MLNLDTHILVFALSGELSKKEQTLLEEHDWSISSIVLWELAKLVQRKRLSLDLEDRTVRRVIEGIQVWPITLEVARLSTQLDFHGDPADELIAATSVVRGLPLVTRDRAIRRSKLVPLA